jgi:hypothetical protein
MNELYRPLDKKTAADVEQFIKHEELYRSLLASADKKSETGESLTHNESIAVRERAALERQGWQAGRV